MKIKAKISFAGVISMHAGETREVDDAETVEDLKQAGYVEEIKAKAAKKDEDE